MAEPPTEDVDAVCASLVREYLFRRGFVDVLRVLDEACPPAAPATATSTADLVQKLHMVNLYQANHAAGRPLPSVLEVLTDYFLRKADSKAGAPAASSATPRALPAAGTAAASDSAASVHLTIEKRQGGAVAAPAPPAAAAPAPALPTPLGAAAAPAPAATGFFARLAAAKRAEQSAAAAAAPAAAPVAAAPVAPAAPAPVVHAAPAAPAAPVANAPAPAVPAPAAAAPSSSGSGGGGSFWARIAAQKAAAAAAAAGGSGGAASPTTAASVAAPQAAAAAVFPTSNETAASAAASAASATAASAPAPAPASAPSFAFTAPDGTGFADRAAYRRYMFETFYKVAGKHGTSDSGSAGSSAGSASGSGSASSVAGVPSGRGAHAEAPFTLDASLAIHNPDVILRAPGEVAGQPFSIADCSDVTIALCDASETVQVDRVARCRIFIAASCESVFLRNCVDCVITLACKQLRTRDCANCTIFLYSKTDPVVEQSHGMLFRPFNGACARLGASMAAARLEPQHSHWRRVFDFSKDDAVLPQPHWQAQPLPVPAPFTIVNLKGCGPDEPAENPVPHASAPRDEGAGTFIPGAGLAAATAGAAPSTMLSFDIRTGQAAAEAALAAAAAVAEAEAQEVAEEEGEQHEAEDASGAGGSSSILAGGVGAAASASAPAPASSAATGSDLRAAPVEAQLPVLFPAAPSDLEAGSAPEAATSEPLHPDANAAADAAAPDAVVPAAGSRLAAVPDAVDPPQPALPAAPAAASAWRPPPAPSAAASAAANAHGLTAEDLDAITFDG